MLREGRGNGNKGIGEGSMYRRGGSGHDSDRADGDGILWDKGSFMCCVNGSGIFLIELPDPVISVDVGQGLPAIMYFRESFPPNQVLELMMPFPCTRDGFYFPFRWLAIDKVRDGPLVLVAIYEGFFVRGEEGSMEDIVDLPQGG
jgi:hypothetical protein